VSSVVYLVCSCSPWGIALRVATFTVVARDGGALVSESGLRVGVRVIDAYCRDHKTTQALAVFGNSQTHLWWAFRGEHAVKAVVE